MSKKGKNANGLMRHIRNNHQVNIVNSKEKQELLNIGYYHGYKACRFIKSSKNIQPYRNFQEIKSVYDFDNSLKTIFYPMLIKIETSLKNRLIDFLVHDEDSDIEYIYNHNLNDYNRFNSNTPKYKKYLKKRLELRNKIDQTIAFNYAKGSPIIQHFFHSSKPIPLWAYFEVITFGELGVFISCLHKDYRTDFTKNISLHHSGFNQNGRILENIIFSLTDLRNSVMHNSILFDCRFNNSDISNQLKHYLEKQTNIKDITFDNIIDFLVLLIYLLSKQHTNKTDLKRYIREFDAAKEELYKSIPTSSYFEIMGSNVKEKTNSLYDYIRHV